MRVTSKYREDNFLIPVLDAGFNKSFQKTVDIFGGTGLYMANLRFTMSTKSISIDLSEHIAEPMFIDSKYSIFIQLTDCVAGLRSCLDDENLDAETDTSDYKKEMILIAKRLNNNVEFEEIIEMNLSGVKQGPSLRSKNS